VTGPTPTEREMPPYTGVYFESAYPAQPYPPQGQYPVQPYQAQPYQAQPYPAQPYPAQPYPAQAYPPQGQYVQYPVQPYPQGQYPGQPYPGQPYPGVPPQIVIHNNNVATAVGYGMRKRNSVFLHLVLFFFTFGVGNILYAWYVHDWNRRRGM
jgi:hypothetical protein